MWKIPVYTTKKVKGQIVKTLAFESKYTSEKQAKEARLTLIHLANSTHFAPCDITVNSNGETFAQNPSWNVGEVTYVN